MLSRGPVPSLRIEKMERRDYPAAPSLTFDVTMLSQQMVELSGTVTDEAPDQVIVQFTGVASGAAAADAAGHYSLVTTASNLGTVVAEAIDNEGLRSDPVQDDVVSNAPQIVNFRAIEAPGRVWTFRGQVVDESAQGLTVTFGGLPSLAGQTCTVGPNGEILLTVQLARGENGIATAITTDWWGLQSNNALAVVQPTNTVSIQSTTTADNHYGLLLGDGNGGDLVLVGRNEMGATGNPGAYNWSEAETFNFIAGDGDYIYLVAWDAPNESGGPQMWLGQFQFPDNSLLLSETSNWEYIVASGPNPSRVGGDGALPSLSTLASEIDVATAGHGWMSPSATAPQGTSPWQTIPGISSNAQFIWGDTLSDNAPSDDHYLIFRTVAPVTPLNHPPSAVNDAAITNANTALPISGASLLSNDSDLDNDSLEIIAVSPTTVAGSTVVLNVNDQTITYTPPPNYLGTDTFTYTIRDSRGWTAQGTVTVDVQLGSGQVRATLTADNHYGLYRGAADGSQLALVGRNESGLIGNPGPYNWSLPETFVFDAVDDYIYVVAWDGLIEGGGPQMWIGDFASGAGSTLLSNTTDWEFAVGGINPSLRPGMEGELPPISEVMTSIALGAWSAPLASAPNGTGPWNTIPGVSSSAQYIWSDTLSDIAPSDGFYVIFRATVPSAPLAPLSAAAPSLETTTGSSAPLSTGRLALDSALLCELLSDDGSAISGSVPSVPAPVRSLESLGELSAFLPIPNVSQLDHILTQLDLGTPTVDQDLIARLGILLDDAAHDSLTPSLG